jgi:hypothetical protein
LTLLNFNKLFEVKYDAYDVGIKVVLTWDKNPKAFFIEKLNAINWSGQCNESNVIF